MNGKEIIKILEKNGYQEVRVKGSHHMLENMNGKTVTVPVHGKKDIKIGTLKSIEKKSGVLLKQ